MSENLTRDDLRSDEELHFLYWLREATEAGLVHSWAYEPRSWRVHEGFMIDRETRMKTKTKISHVSLFDNRNELFYTPDYVFGLTNIGGSLWRNSVFWRSIQGQAGNNPLTIHVDIKGSFNRHGGSHAEFYLKQRLMWDAHGIYVQKVNPKVFFTRTWAPEALRWCKGRKKPTLTKLGNKTCDIEDFLRDNASSLQGSLFDN